MVKKQILSLMLGAAIVGTSAVSAMEIDLYEMDPSHVHAFNGSTPPFSDPNSNHTIGLSNLLALKDGALKNAGLFKIGDRKYKLTYACSHEDTYLDADHLNSTLKLEYAHCTDIHILHPITRL